MDELDRKIVRTLQVDGRITNQELASRVGLSPSPCLRRLRRLESEGVIEGYAAMVDQGRYGLPLDIFVQVKLERHTEETVRTFEEHVRAVDEILDCYLMTGSADYLLHLASADLEHYDRFMRMRLQNIPGIAAIETSFAIKAIKRRGAFPRV
ncbi:MAG: Lrp/AsnC family transcriptional regulator [Deltaproteobacteria bacterium]|nr:Lrp/AsnC family transcriptional regulator [Deltaproteobacteria bacterium]